MPGLGSASAVVNGTHFNTVPGIDVRYESGSHSFVETNGAQSLTILDSNKILSNDCNRQFFDDLAKVALVLFQNPQIQANNASKMSSGHADIKM